MVVDGPGAPCGQHAQTRNAVQLVFRELPELMPTPGVLLLLHIVARPCFRGVWLRRLHGMSHDKKNVSVCVLHTCSFGAVLSAASLAPCVTLSAAIDVDTTLLRSPEDSTARL